MKVKKRLSHKDSSIGLRRTETAIFTPAACGSELGPCTPAVHSTASLFKPDKNLGCYSEMHQSAEIMQMRRIVPCGAAAFHLEHILQPCVKVESDGWLDV